jgi:hypothetical protein
VTGRLWVGIDPGAKETGIILRDGRTIVLAEVVTNWYYQHGDPSSVGADYLTNVVATAAKATTTLTDLAEVAVEGVKKPCPHLGLTDPSAIIGAGIVLGAVLLEFPAAVVVPPGGNGSGMLDGYPAGLVTDAERRGGLNRKAGQSAHIRHCRSAWDVSLAAPRIARMGAALAAAGGLR